MRKTATMIVDIFFVAVVSCILSGLALGLLVNIPFHVFRVLGETGGSVLMWLLVFMIPAIIVVTGVVVFYVLKKKELVTLGQGKCMLIVANLLYALMLYGMGAMLSNDLDFGKGLGLVIELIFTFVIIGIWEVILVFSLIVRAVKYRMKRK